MVEAREDGAAARAQGDGAAKLVLTVRDNGRGIAAGTQPGFGLRGMEERFLALGGDFANRPCGIRDREANVSEGLDRVSAGCASAGPERAGQGVNEIEQNRLRLLIR